MFDALSRYFEFDGRSSRSDLWLSLLLYMGIYIVAIIADVAMFGVTYGFQEYGIAGPISAIVMIASVVPFATIYVRRLHDTGNSGWMLLLLFIPIANLYVLYLILFAGSQAGTNKFGPPHVAASNPATTLPTLAGGGFPLTQPKPEAESPPPLPRRDIPAAPLSEGVGASVAHAPTSQPAPISQVGTEASTLTTVVEGGAQFPTKRESAPVASLAERGSDPIASPPPLSPPPQQGRAEPAAPPPPNPQPSIRADAVEMMLQKLAQLGQLRDQGILNDEEFAAQKERILRESSASS